ncbi:MAG: type II toxin-antitoxin system VapC family toxin [Microthrixaceae bacterium]
MIAYFDTSALVPLLVEEPGSERAGRMWDESSRVASVRLAYPEARAALAQAQRDARITAPALRQTVRELDRLFDQLDVVEVTATLAHRAGELAEAHSLRGYDAVHIAAAEQLFDEELVLVAGDAAMLRAGETLGWATASTD